MLDFKPPKDNILMIGISKWLLLPLSLRFSFKGLRLDIDSLSLNKLNKLNNLSSTDGFPTILAPNHPDHADPYLMFALSKRLGQRFNYMAAREAFHEHYGGRFRGFIMQRLGVYSVRRGTVDREAFRMTKELLKMGKKKLVIFPEGEISHQNDTLMPFENGVVQMAFWALDEMKREGLEKPIYIVPVAIKYRYNRQMWGEIAKALSRLEEKTLPKTMAVHHSENKNLYERLRRVGEVVLSTLEHEYRFSVDQSQPMNQRIEKLREHILQQMEAFLEITPAAAATPLKRVRAIRNLIDEEIYREIDELADYERELHQQRLEKLRQFYLDLNRLINFIALYVGYVQEKMTQERFLEVIIRLEVEVFGNSKHRGPKTGIMRVGNPKNLLEHYESYEKRKREVVQQITEELESEVQQMILQM